MKKRGSTIIILLFVVSALTIMLTAALRNAAYSFDVSLQQMRYEQQRWITEGILNYGIAYVKTNFKELSSLHLSTPSGLAGFGGHRAEPLTESFKDYEGTLKVIPENDNVILIAQLKKDRQVVMSIQCQCNLTFEDKEKKSLKNISISGWRIDEAA
jgi:hypothetical protein